MTSGTDKHKQSPALLSPAPTVSETCCCSSLSFPPPPYPLHFSAPLFHGPHTPSPHPVHSTIPHHCPSSPTPRHLGLSAKTTLAPGIPLSESPSPTAGLLKEAGSLTRSLQAPMGDRKGPDIEVGRDPERKSSQSQEAREAWMQTPIWSWDWLHPGLVYFQGFDSSL